MSNVFDETQALLDRRRRGLGRKLNNSVADVLLKEQAACPHPVVDYEYGAQWKCRGCGAWVTRW